MKYLTIILLFALIAATSCKRDPRPKDALKEDIFIDVLVDIHIAQALYKDRISMKLDSLQSDQLYQDILKKHKVEHDILLTTINYYSRKPNEYDKVFTEVVSRLNKMREEMNLKEKPLVLENEIEEEQLKKAKFLSKEE